MFAFGLFDAVSLRIYSADGKMIDGCCRMLWYFSNRGTIAGFTERNEEKDHENL